jgi:histidine triad (HIT) family protein
MSLEGTYDGANIFAKILRGEAPCIKVFEDDDVLAFMDIFPQSQGHCLVIPKNVTSRNLTDFPTEKIGVCFTAVTQFNGAPAGQTVFHLHVHVIPRYANLPLQPHHGGKPADAAVLREQAARIAAAL